MNQEKHWNAIAPSYEDEIFDVFKSDKNKILPIYFNKHSNPSHLAIDFGCGVGKAFQYLSPRFKEILAIDISSECLSTAKAQPYSNIKFKRLDLSLAKLNIAPAEFAFCCNVIMLPEVDRNTMMLRNIRNSLKPKGTAVIVLPSFESIFYSSWQLIRMYKKEGVALENIRGSEFHYFKSDKRDIVQGIMHINGVPTKHYMQPEIEVIFREAGLKVTAIEKIEYNWNTEFETVPAWMKGPYPWDWLVECRRSS